MKATRQDRAGRGNAFDRMTSRTSPLGHSAGKDRARSRGRKTSLGHLEAAHRPATTAPSVRPSDSIRDSNVTLRAVTGGSDVPERSEFALAGTGERIRR